MCVCVCASVCGCVCVCVSVFLCFSELCVCLFQDQRQTDSIQALQAHLENVTQLVLSLSVSVSRLQREVISSVHNDKTPP